MKSIQYLSHKIFNLDQLKKEIARQKLKGKKIVVTNGVFDLLHQGHLSSLQEAAIQGDFLVVALNADESVKRLKGSERPIQDQQTRALVLANLMVVDAVVIFETDTPKEIIIELMPDVLVKGGDYTIEQIAGAQEVLAAGGKVVLAHIVDGFSTTLTIDKLKS